MENVLLDVVSELAGLKPYNVYFDNFDKNWHIDNECSLKFFHSKDEADKEAEKLLYLDIISKVAETLSLDYGFDGKVVNISIE